MAAVFLAACADAPSEEHVVNEPVRLEEVQPGDGSTGDDDVDRVILTPRAAERTGIETAQVEREGKRLVVPHSAILFDPQGRVWVYTNPEPLVFVRHEVKLVTETGDTAILSEGPSPGTRVVTIGVPELYGAEYEIGH
ncbi:MAG TPA: hypothetical protein VHH54_03905 [Actinomycetota bacterium]|nr:hypothetical protein [Actinomycetota bacterium]